MATLEVHKPRGPVEYVDLPPHAAALIGADPKCDVVLNEPGVAPIHARLRWKRGRLKVETTPGSEPLVVNDHRVLSTKLRQGDEIHLGGCRIFVLKLEGSDPETEKTVIKAPPGVAEERPRRGSRTTSAPVAPSPREARNLFDQLEVAPPSFEVSLQDAGDYEHEPKRAGAAPLARGRQGRQEAAPVDGKGKGKGKGKVGPGSLRRWWRSLSGEDRAPGDERIISSPVVLGLVAALAVLAVLSFSLWRTISRRAAEGQFQLALDSFQDGDYLNAQQRFGQFLERYPGDDRTSRARVLHSLAGVRRFTTGAAPAWGEALTAARSMADESSGESAYPDVRIDLSDDVLKIAEALADRARIAGDAGSLAEAEAATALHAEIAGKAAADTLARSRLPGKLAAARAAVQKTKVRQAALAAMDQALKDGSARGVYDARDQLVAEYADQANDPAVIERLRKGNDLLRQAVKLDPARRSAEPGPRAEILGPPTTLVLRSARQPSAAASDESAVVLARADGFAFGLAASDGRPLWQFPVGLDSPFPPLTIAGDEATALLVDARSQELTRLRSRTGEVLWRQELGERVISTPLVLGNDLFQATPGGKLLRIDLASGELRGTLDLGQQLAQAPVADEMGQHLYIVADRANLFVLTRDPFACVAVEYLGHEAGAVPCAPVRIGKFLVVPINNGIEDGYWQIELLGDEGAHPRPIQRIPITGWTWSPPTVRGSVIWATGDRGGLSAYAIGAETEAEPFQSIAQIAPEARAIGPVFALARTERDLIVAGGRVASFRLNSERGKIEPSWTLTEAGKALGPIQEVGRRIVLTQLGPDGQGTALWGIDPSSGAVAWTTILGAPWPAPLQSSGTSGEDLATLGPDGRHLIVPRSRLETGGFIEQMIPIAGSVRVPVNPAAIVPGEGLTLLVPEIGGRRWLVADEKGSLKPVELPAPLAAAPRFWGSDVILPARDGMVYLVDPRTGVLKADPFVPPYERENPIRWLAPTVLDGGAIAMVEASGRVRRLRIREEHRPRLEQVGEVVNLGSALVADPVASGTVLIVATADGRIRALSQRDLSPVGAWSLASPLALGPVAVRPFVLTVGADGDALLLDGDGRRVWSKEVQMVSPVGVPAIAGEALWWLGRDGGLRRLVVADGTALDREMLDLLPAGGPRPVGGSLAIPTAPGTVQFYSPTANRP